jgi:hypothetical protein
VSKNEKCGKTRENDEAETDAGAEPTMAEEVRDRWIAIAAYYRAAQRGFVENHDLEDWFSAENEYEELKAKKTGKN